MVEDPRLREGLTRRRRRLLEQAEELADDEEEEATADDLSGTVDDLTVEDTMADRQGSVTIPSDDLPIETDALPIPKPYQGLQRAAVVFNFNFVWDDDADQWVRDTGNPSGVGEGVYAFVTTDQTISASNTETVDYDATRFDDRNEFDASTDSVTVTETGLYLVSVGLDVYNLPDQEFATARILAGSETLIASSVSASTSNAGSTRNTLRASGGVRLTDGDTVTVEIANQTSQNLVVDNNEAGSYLSVVQVGGPP